VIRGIGKIKGVHGVERVKVDVQAES